MTVPSPFGGGSGQLQIAKSPPPLRWAVAFQPTGDPPPAPMSLHRLKETLHACSSSSSQPQTQPRSPPPPALLQRRPPKTSLSEQLLRLEAAAGSSSSSFSSRIAQLPPVPRPPIEKPREDDEPTPSDEEEERRIHPISRPRPPPLPAAALQSRGPYEPLVLSPPGEHPVVQVPYNIYAALQIDWLSSGAIDSCKEGITREVVLQTGRSSLSRWEGKITIF